MHEHPFSIIEEEGFNMIQKRKKECLGDSKFYMLCVKLIMNYVQDGEKEVESSL